MSVCLQAMDSQATKIHRKPVLFPQPTQVIEQENQQAFRQQGEAASASLALGQMENRLQRRYQEPSRRKVVYVRSARRAWLSTGDVSGLFSSATWRADGC